MEVFFYYQEHYCNIFQKKKTTEQYIFNEILFEQ